MANQGAEYQELTADQESAIVSAYCYISQDLRKLSKRFGVSRATIRKVLATKAAQNRISAAAANAVAKQQVDDLAAQCQDRLATEAGQLALDGYGQLLRNLLSRMDQMTPGMQMNLLRLLDPAKAYELLKKVSGRDSTSGDDQLFESLVDKFGKALER